VVAAGLEVRRGAGAHVAGVEDAAGARRDGPVDRGTMLPHSLVAHLVDGDDEHLGGPLEGVSQAAGVGEAALTHPYALVGERLRLLRLADAEADLVRRHAGQQLFDDLASKQSGGSGHDDHYALQRASSSGIRLTVSSILTMTALVRYR
jgi:hypothetical protein